METIGTILSQVQEAWNVAPQFLFNPEFWGILLAVLVLASICSIARSVNRLNRQLSSAVKELEEIRSALKGVERILERSPAKSFRTDKEAPEIWDLPLREGKGNT